METRIRPRGHDVALTVWILLTIMGALTGTGARAGTSGVVGGRLIDGTGGRPIPYSVILMDGERITAIGQIATLAVPDGATVISTEGMDVLPGLWDMHVHLMINVHADYAHWDETYPPLFEKVIMPAPARQLLLAGVTSARDLGAPLEESIAVKRAIERGESPKENAPTSSRCEVTS
jgi:imidazolonepropionase-like amidohydrolase